MHLVRRSPCETLPYPYVGVLQPPACGEELKTISFCFPNPALHVLARKSYNNPCLAVKWVGMSSGDLSRVYSRGNIGTGGGGFFMAPGVRWSLEESGHDSGEGEEDGLV